VLSPDGVLVGLGLLGRGAAGAALSDHAPLHDLVIIIIVIIIVGGPPRSAHPDRL
jgi:hypothetical protein